jgi:hypothetical protein
VRMTAPAPAARAAPAPSADPLALMFSAGGGGAAPVAAAAPSADPFGGMFGSAPSAAASDAKSVSAKMSPAVQAKLSGLRRSPANGDVSLGGSAALAVSWFKAFPGEKLLLVMLLTNTSGATLSDVAVQLDLPNGLSVNYDGDPLPQGKGPTFIVARIGPNSTATSLVYLSASNPMCAAKLGPNAVGVAVSYTGAPSLVRGAIGLDLSDLLRPAPMTTDRFGAHWKGATAEKKWTVSPTTVTTPADFIARAQNAVGLYHVQKINLENICAGKLVAPANQDNTLCLVHGRFKGTALEVTVRTANADYTTALQALVNAAFV